MDGRTDRPTDRHRRKSMPFHLWKEGWGEGRIKRMQNYQIIHAHIPIKCIKLRGREISHSQHRNVFSLKHYLERVKQLGTYRLGEQRRFRQACASAQSRQNLRCSLIQAVSQEEPSDRKPNPWPLWMAGHAQLKFVMTECSKTQIRLTGISLFRTNSAITARLELIFSNVPMLHFP